MISLATTGLPISHDQEHDTFAGCKRIPAARAMSWDGLVVYKLGAVSAVNVRINIIRSSLISNSKVKRAVSVEAVWAAVDRLGGKSLK